MLQLEMDAPENSGLEDAAQESGIDESQGEFYITNRDERQAARPSSLEKAPESEASKADDSSLLSRIKEAYAVMEDSEDTPDGAVAIICHKSKDGNIEFLLEEKPADYQVAEARGKLSFVGGAMKKGESSLEALARELEEEIEEPVASILISSLRKDEKPYTTLRYKYKGVKGYVDVYVINVEQESKWNAVRWASFKHDAGIPKIVNNGQIAESNFAFEYEKVIKGFIDDFRMQKFTPFLYPDSISRPASELPVFGLPRYSLAGPLDIPV